MRSTSAGTHVDSDTLPSKSTRSTDTVDIIFTVPAYDAMVRQGSSPPKHNYTKSTYDGRS